MRILSLLRVFLFVACACVLPLSEAGAVSKLVGPGAVTPYFDGSDEYPQLELSGPQFVDIGTGFEVYAGTAGVPNAFELKIDFYDGKPPDRYEDLIVTAALKPNVDYSGVTVRFSWEEEYVALRFDHGDFVDVNLFGLPELSSIPGVGYGTGGFMSLEHARIAGVDLESDLTRGENNPYTMQIQILGVTNPDQLIRFDVFGLCEFGVVMGNNPNAGAAGFQVGPVRPVPEPAAIALYLAGFGAAGFSLRKRLFTS